jgi:CheY-like chemotaxis protein
MILLVEDDEDDQEFLKLAFQKTSAKQSLHIANNGQKALDYLYQLSEKDYPCLIVLDLNMPVLDGIKTLEALKGKPAFNNIPKVVLTTSDSDEDKARCLSNGATDYLIKPHNMKEIIKTVENMLRYCD